MSRDSALWIGGVEKYMTEDFLKKALSLMGEEGVVSVKIIKNKFTGQPASYGFIHFDSDAAALMAMHKLNGKIIPHSQPPVRFQLNHASAKASGSAYTDREYSIWVSDLPKDISEEDFRKGFSTRFNSLKTSKLIREKDKVFGFVRFTDLNDQRDAQIHMNGFYGFGEKPIKVSLAIPKRTLAAEEAQQSKEYSQMYENYLYDRGAWANYGSYQGAGQPILVSDNATTTTSNLWDFFENDSDSEDEAVKDKKDEERFIDHSVPINVDRINQEYIARSTEVWDSIEQDRWIYNLDNEEGIAPNFRKLKKD